MAAGSAEPSANAGDHFSCRAAAVQLDLRSSRVRASPGCSASLPPGRRWARTQGPQDPQRLSKCATDGVMNCLQRHPAPVRLQPPPPAACAVAAPNRAGHPAAQLAHPCSCAAQHCSAHFNLPPCPCRAPILPAQGVPAQHAAMLAAATPQLPPVNASWLRPLTAARVTAGARSRGGALMQ